MKELEKKELMKVQGGGWIVNGLWFLAGVVFSEINDRNSANDFKEGYERFKIDYKNQ